MPCCKEQFCSSCYTIYITTNIHDRKTKIGCPRCSQDIDSSVILYNDELPKEVRARYQEILAENLSDNHIKLCPYCNYITILDEKHASMYQKKSRRSSRQWIVCHECKKEWCWSCYSPSHPSQTCQQFKNGEILLDLWAETRRVDDQKRNAQRCPKCNIYIEKIDGCDHMTCTKCDSTFCYRCGSRMRLPAYIGHDATYSIFGCKYKLYPDCALLRWLIRGSIFIGVLLIAPIILVMVIALVIALIPVACVVLPIYMCVRCSTRYQARLYTQSE